MKAAAAYARPITTTNPCAGSGRLRSSLVASNSSTTCTWRTPAETSLKRGFFGGASECVFATNSNYSSALRIGGGGLVTTAFDSMSLVAPTTLSRRFYLFNSPSTPFSRSIIGRPSSINNDSRRSFTTASAAANYALPVTTTHSNSIIFTNNRQKQHNNRNNNNNVDGNAIIFHRFYSSTASPAQKETDKQQSHHDNQGDHHDDHLDKPGPDGKAPSRLKVFIKRYGALGVITYFSTFYQ